MRERVERRQNLDTPLNRLSIAESDRVNVLLAAEGLKRATNIEIPFGESHPEFRATILSEDAMQLAITRTRQTLRTMGLVVARLPSQRNPGSDQIVYTARKQEDADRLAQLFPLNLRGTAMPEEIEELGKLFGFPKSAVEAYTIMSEQGKEELLMDASQLPPEIMNDRSQMGRGGQETSAAIIRASRGGIP